MTGPRRCSYVRKWPPSEKGCTPLPYTIKVAIEAINDTEKEGRERNVLFNDALNSFYLLLYGVGHNGKEPFR